MISCPVKPLYIEFIIDDYFNLNPFKHPDKNVLRKIRELVLVSVLVLMRFEELISFSG